MMVAEVESAEHSRARGLSFGLTDPLPRWLLAPFFGFGRRGGPELACACWSELARSRRSRSTVAERADDHAASAASFSSGTRPRRDVDDVLDRDALLRSSSLSAWNSLDGEVRGEDRARDLVLAFLDALGERDLALAREERDAAHLAEVEPHRILGAADRARREVDRVGRAPSSSVSSGSCAPGAPISEGSRTALARVDDARCPSPRTSA